MRITPRPLLLALAMLVVIAAVAHAGLATLTISQRHRAFNPNALQIGRGGTVEIVNDDGELVHHAYVESDRFKFDSGEQQPGSRTDIIFPVAGTFTVLCRIHPRMHLEVTVQ